MLNWADLDPMKVERAIKALLRDLYPDLRSVEGSGGDGGRDAYRLREGNAIQVFEIKSYSRTLNNGQKTKIEKSLRSALTHQGIDDWVLILPHDQTPSEEEWFTQKLAGIADPVTLSWRGRDWLDKEFASRGDLRRFVEGPDSQLLKHAQEYGLETAVLAGGLSDLVGRQTSLGRLAEDLSPYWRIEPATVEGHTTIEVRPKHPAAPEIDPIAIDLRIGSSEPSDRDAALTTRAAYEQVIAFGGQVAIDPRYIEGIDITASQQTAALFGNLLSGPIHTVEFSTLPEPTGPPLTGVLETIGRSDRITASARIVSDQRHRGTRGTTLYARDESGGVHLSIPVPHQVSPDLPPASMQLEVGPFTGCQADSAQHILEVLAAAARGDRLQVRFGRSIKGLAHRPATAAALPDLKPLAALVEDLITLQNHTGHDIPIPGDRPLSELESASTFARAIRGERVRLAADSIFFTLYPDRVDEYLDAYANRPESGMLMTLQDGRLDFNGRSFSLGPITYHAPMVVLANHTELAEGTWDGEPVARLNTADGEGIYLLPIPAC